MFQVRGKTARVALMRKSKDSVCVSKKKERKIKNTQSMWKFGSSRACFGLEIYI